MLIPSAVGPQGPHFQLTPFRGDRENESHGGLGGGGRPQLNSVHRQLDRTGLEFLVSSSTKAAFQFQGVGLAGAESPSGLLKQLCPVPRLPFDSGHSLGPAVVPEPPRFLGSPAMPGTTIVACGSLDSGLFFWTVSAFLFSFPSLALSREL